MFVELIVGALAGAAIGAGVYFLVKLAFGAIKDWLGKSIEQHPDADTAVLVREKLDSGNYSVVCGIFEDGELVDSRTWECEKLDDELKAEFGRKKKVIYDLTYGKFKTVVQAIFYKDSNKVLDGVQYESKVIYDLT